jgi:HEAT repeat protein
MKFLSVFGFSLVWALASWAASADDARKILTDAAAHKEGNTRRDAAVALSLSPTADPASQLLNTLITDKDYLVRIAAIESLGEIRDTKRVGLLKTALEDEVPEVIFAAARELHDWKVAEGTDALEAIYLGEMKAKSNFMKKEWLNSVRRLKTPKSAFFFAVQRGATFVPVPGVGAGVRAMSDILSHVELSPRAISLIEVCQQKNPACGEFLEMAFRDEDWTVRASALHVTIQQKLVKNLPAVETLMQDKKDQVRFQAAATYLRFQKPVRAAKKKQ